MLLSATSMFGNPMTTEEKKSLTERVTLAMRILPATTRITSVILAKTSFFYRLEHMPSTLQHSSSDYELALQLLEELAIHEEARGVHDSLLQKVGSLRYRVSPSDIAARRQLTNLLYHAAPINGFCTWELPSAHN